jgi:hypothetical protein
MPLTYRDTLLWSLQKDFRRIDCVLRETPKDGCEVRIAFLRGMFESRMFPTKEDALWFARERHDCFLTKWGILPERIVKQHIV